MIVDAAIRSHRRALVLLVTVALLAFLPGFFTIPPVDRDGSRFAQATEQIDRERGLPRHPVSGIAAPHQPIGIYWLQAAVVQAARTAGLPDALTTIWLYRVPSMRRDRRRLLHLLGGTGVGFAARGRAAALMMAACPLLGIEARLATTDAMLLMTTAAAMGGLARVYLHAHGRPLAAAAGWAATAVVWTALALGVLLKGPVILLVAGLCAATITVRDRSFRWLAGLRPLAGVPWFIALTLPWSRDRDAVDQRHLPASRSGIGGPRGAGWAITSSCSG